MCHPPGFCCRYFTKSAFPRPIYLRRARTPCSEWRPCALIRMMLLRKTNSQIPLIREIFRRARGVNRIYRASGDDPAAAFKAMARPGNAQTLVVPERIPEDQSDTRFIEWNKSRSRVATALSETASRDLSQLF